jgi:hypothetical protein
LDAQNIDDRQGRKMKALRRAEAEAARAEKAEIEKELAQEAEMEADD